GGIEKKEASIHLSNLMLVDPKTGNPTRTGRKIDAKGKLVRYSKKTGEVING
ncbi:MAG: 50S ribosomal protein L24, partial [Bacteroidota bacterium]